MLTVSNVSLNFGEKELFKDVNLQFVPGNCYGIIGANGAGKSTFLKVLSGEIDNFRGEISLKKGARLSFLKQEQERFDDYTPLETTIMGNEKLYNTMKTREEFYSKESLTDEEGMMVAELEGEFAELGGYEAENNASIILNGLGLNEDDFEKKLKNLDSASKVKCLLAQALFGNPDILLLDEPTNNLSIVSINWLEKFLLDFKNVVIVVSHDRHFMNSVCTHICDIDYSQIKMYPGNYDFWYESSQLIRKQMKDAKKKASEKAEELKSFIQRFSANKSKSKQATSRVKMLEKLNLDELPQTSRKFPYISFQSQRELGKKVLKIENLTYSVKDLKLFNKLNLEIDKGDKVCLVGPNDFIKTTFFDIIALKIESRANTVSWGETAKFEYIPKNNTEYFEGNNETVFDWLSKYSTEKDLSYIRGFLGRMLFSQEEANKKVKVLSGGEKVRLMLAKAMILKPNVLILDDPTNHLDLEAINALNNGLIEFNGTIIFSSHDHEFVDTISNRIIEMTPLGLVDKRMDFESYIENDDIKELRFKLYENKKDSVF